MGSIQSPAKVVPLLGVSSRHEQAFAWAVARVEDGWGEVVLRSDRFPFDQTTYYESSMGPHLSKQFLAVSPPIDPGRLASLKCETNRWEEEFVDSQSWPEQRPINLDPGYISEGKLVLASTKNHAHRIYLSDGIYAEVTLCFQRGGWRKQPWTYPDYQTEEYQSFFTQCRDYLRQQRRAAR